MNPEYILQRLRHLCETRQYSFYMLSRKSGVALSTITGLYARCSYPSIPTLYKLCQALRITLGDFFTETAPNAALTEADRRLLNRFHQLSDDRKQCLTVYLEALSAGDTP